MSPEPPRSKPSDERDDATFGRMLALVVLATAANFWLEHHLGLGIGDPRLLGLVGASLTAGIGFLDRVADKAERESFGRRVRSVLRPLLATPVLAVLYLLAGVVALSYSSLLVSPESGSGPLRLTVTALDRGEMTRSASAGAGDPVRLPLRVTAFGRSFRVEAAGYLPKVVDVPPLTGRRLDAARDLVALPSLLLRPPPRALRSLRGAGTFHLDRVEGDRRVPIIEPARGASSFLVGRPRPVPSSLLGTWRLELAAKGLGEAELARELLEWNTPTVIEPLEPIRPGMRLVAEVRTASGKSRARATILVSDDKLSDIALIEVLGEA